jgi:hypothetical protein
MCRRIAAVIVDMIAAGDSQLLAVRVDATEVTALIRPVSGESLVDRTLEVRKFEVTPAAGHVRLTGYSSASGRSEVEFIPS